MGEASIVSIGKGLPFDSLLQVERRLEPNAIGLSNIPTDVRSHQDMRAGGWKPMLHSRPGPFCGWTEARSHTVISRV